MNKQKAAKNFHDGDKITIEGKEYIIARFVGGDFTLIEASSFTPADFE